MEKKNVRISALMGAVMLLTGCVEKYNLGDGFYVTYVDLQQLRGIYYNNQSVNGEISVRGVYYNDTLIFYYGCPFSEPNTIDSTKLIYYVIKKVDYESNPDQLKSLGQYGPLTPAEVARYKTMLKDNNKFRWW